MQKIDLIAITKLLWQRRKIIIIWASLGFIIGTIVAFSIPSTYSSYIKIAPEETSKGVSGSAGEFALMMGINTSDGNNGISKTIYQDIIKSSPFILEFVDIEVVNNNKKIPLWYYLDKEQKKAWWGYIVDLPAIAIKSVRNLFSEEGNEKNIHTDNEMQYAFIGKFSGSTAYNSDKKTNIITIQTTFQDPIIATIVADSILVKLQKYITRYKTQKTRQNLESNIILLEQAKEEFYKLDDLYASSVDRNQNLISEKSKVKIERLRNERDLAFQVYQKLALQVATDKMKLQEDTPIATLIEPARVPILKTAPNKKMIAIGFVFISILCCSAMLVFKEIKKNALS